MFAGDDTYLLLALGQIAPATGSLISDFLGLRSCVKLLGNSTPVVLHEEEERGQGTLGSIGVRGSALALLLVTARAGIAQQTALIKGVGDVIGQMREVEVG